MSSAEARRRQFATFFAIELRHLLWGRRGVALLLFAALPLPIFAVGAMVSRVVARGGDAAQAASVFAAVFQVFLLRAVVFFGCVATFTQLFRGEILGRTLHYLLLVPIRRELVVLGKYAAAVVATTLAFSAMVTIGFALTLVPFGVSSAAHFVFDGPGLGQLGSYLLVVLCACVGYGSIFVFFGLCVRNPILPAALVLGWELLHFLLPPVLKRLTVIHYLKTWIPSPLAEGPFAVLSAPESGVVAVLGILAIGGVGVAAATWRLARLELDYSE